MANSDKERSTRKMLFSIAALLLPLALANHEIYSSNLNFRSPYLSQPGLALDTRAIHARHQTESKIIKREAQLSRRQAQESRPDGQPTNYNYVGYGLGVTSWDDADYIYAGSINYTHSVASGESQQYNGPSALNPVLAQPDS